VNRLPTSSSSFSSSSSASSLPPSPIAHRRRRQVSSPTCCINARLYIHLRLRLHLRLPLPWKQKRSPLSRFILGTINPSTNRLSIPIAGFCASRTAEPLSAYLPSFKSKIFCPLPACLPAIDLAGAAPFNRFLIDSKLRRKFPSRLAHRTPSLHRPPRGRPRNELHTFFLPSRRLD
jgi:hypothetical protein